MTTLRVVFEDPGWFLADCHLTVAVDGDEIYSGSFNDGFEVDVETWPGTHRIYTCIQNAFVERRRAYAFEVQDVPEQTFELNYSRFWGNFATEKALQSA